jgi:hypothetical protein
MFIFVVVAREFLVNLLRNVSELSTVCIRKVKLGHIAADLLELFRCR